MNIPIGKLLRKRKSHSDDDGNSDSQSKKLLSMTIDDEIARLEAELSKEIDSDSESLSGSEDNGDFEENEVDEGHQRRNHTKESVDMKVIIDKDVRLECDDSGNVIKLATAIDSEDYIPPLPQSMLPSGRFAFDKSVKKKKKLEQASGSDNNDSKSRSSGLESTIMEMLLNYTPASHEKLPFWCRICRYQGLDMDDLIAHRGTEMHSKAAVVEAKLSYCKMCRKQFTSPDQLKDHIAGKGHKALREHLRSRRLSKT